MNSPRFTRVQGLFISRLDFFQRCRKRTLWKTPTLLPLKHLSDEHHIHVERDSGDVVLTCLELQGVRGISVVHYNSRIQSIYLHRQQYDDSSMYGQVHQEGTWIYCPIDDKEAIVGIWLVRHSAIGTGLVVCHLNPINIEYV
jgi:hypothetical protein